VITKPQKKLIAIASETPLIRDNFWLSGGTALSEFYLNHRTSRDLDFFTDEKDGFKASVREFMQYAQDKGVPLTADNISATFARLTGSLDGELIKVEFCVDAPFRFLPTSETDLGIRVENSVDIACNKLSALYDRSEIRDFVDVYLIHRELYSLDKLIPWTKEKHGGFDNYMLALAFQKIKRIPDDFPLFPVTSKPLDKKKLRKLFLTYAGRLIKEPFEAKPYSA